MRFVIMLALILPLLFNSGCAHVSPGKIAFVSDKGGAPFIYVMNPDGSNPTKLGSWFGVPNTFCWSPDGTRIAFIDEDGWLCSVNADGTSLSKLAEIPSYSISWSPDGRKIAAGCFDQDIYTVDVATGKLKNLTNSPGIKEGSPSWSPDSKKIAFVVSDPPYCDIGLMDADGGNRTTLISDRGIYNELAWSPSGEKIVYIWDSGVEPGREGICYDICVVDTKDYHKTNLTCSSHDDDREPSWSPDGKKIVFSSRRQVTDMQIYVMNADGSQLTKLTTGDSSKYSPSWSPDGRRIVFTSGGPYPARDDVCIMNADGSNVVNLTNTPDIDDYLAIWSPQ
jgi:Tol biopolymer transport system component